MLVDKPKYNNPYYLRRWELWSLMVRSNIFNEYLEILRSEIDSFKYQQTLRKTLNQFGLEHYWYEVIDNFVANDDFNQALESSFAFYRDAEEGTNLLIDNAIQVDTITDNKSGTQLVQITFGKNVTPKEIEDNWHRISSAQNKIYGLDIKRTTKSKTFERDLYIYDLKSMNKNIANDEIISNINNSQFASNEDILTKKDIAMIINRIDKKISDIEPKQI